MIGWVLVLPEDTSTGKHPFCIIITGGAILTSECDGTGTLPTSPLVRNLSPLLVRYSQTPFTRRRHRYLHSASWCISRDHGCCVRWQHEGGTEDRDIRLGWSLKREKKIGGHWISGIDADDGGRGSGMGLAEETTRGNGDNSSGQNQEWFGNDMRDEGAGVETAA